MKSLVLAFALALGCPLSLTACGGQPPRTDPPVDAGTMTVVTVSGLSATVNPRNKLSYYIQWSTDAALPTELDVDCGPEYQQHFFAEQTRGEHRVFVMGLLDGLSCEFQVHASRDASHLAGETSLRVDGVGGLPAALPALIVNARDASALAPGWTLTAFGNASGVAADSIAVALDDQARVRWYYEAGVSYVNAEASVLPVAGGLLLGNLRRDSRLVDWEGQTLFTVGTKCHHDLRLSPWNSDHLLFPSSRDEPCAAGGGVEHSIVEFDRAAGQVVWEWWSCDHWTPRVAYSGWSHVNAVEPFPGERAILASSRNQDALFKIDRDSGALIWTLGMDGDFTMDPADHFLRQHDPELQPDGTILIFDNGLKPAEAPADGLSPREYSRVLQLALSFDAQGLPDRADLVWDYTDLTVFATSRSGADRLPNGNTLIHYAYVLPDRRTILREVTPTGDIVWDVVTQGAVASYRSERTAARYGYVFTE